MLRFDAETDTVTGSQIIIQRRADGYLVRQWSAIAGVSLVVTAKAAFVHLQKENRASGGDEERCLVFVQAIGWSDLLDDALAAWESAAKAKHAAEVPRRITSERDYDRFRGCSQRDIQETLLKETGNPPSAQMQAWQIVQEVEKREAFFREDATASRQKHGVSGA